MPSTGEPLPSGPGGNLPGGASNGGDEPGAGGQPGGEELPGGGDGASGSNLPGSGGVPNRDGWETSNETPLPAPRPAPPMPGQGSGGGGELEEALGVLDGQILAEREVLEQRSNEQPGGSAPQGAAGGGSPSAGADPAQTQAGGPPAPANRPAPPMPQGEAPEDIADAQDDDIVARQLREAALAEPDPVLREKLWEEYRRYKGSGG